MAIVRQALLTPVGDVLPNELTSCTKKLRFVIVCRFMQYRQLGKHGIKLSELSFGAWVTFGKQLDLSAVKKLMQAAFEGGVNFFDNAETYASGEAETLMGKALKDFRREDLVVSTKIFWGGKGPNDTGLSWKHLMEGTNNSLRRLQLDYVDLLFCHRPDPNTPIEETVRAMDVIVRSGKAFYWGTSEWKAEQIEEAHRVAREIHCIPPAMEQPQYNFFERNKVEKDFLPLYSKYGMGLTIWSPLALGILTGKYNQGIPKGSRLEKEDWLARDLTPKRIETVRALEPIAKQLECSLAQLAIAWCLKNPHVSSVITGASRLEQLEENLGACEVAQKLTPQILKQMNSLT